MTNSFLKLNKINNLININYVSILFSFFIFFWMIKIGFFQLRFLILILLVPIFLNFNNKLFKKFIIYFIFSIIFLLHSHIQSNNLLSNIYYNSFSILILFSLFFIFDCYKKFFFENLDKIIYLYLIILFIFIAYQFFLYNDFFSEVSNKCIDCLSILKHFHKENSHFGLLSSAIIYYLLFISKVSKYIRFPFLILFCIVCLVNLSITFVVGIVLVFFSTITFHNKSHIFYKFIFFIIIAIPIILNQELDKRKISDFFTVNNKIDLRTNLSTEVYQVSLFVTKKAILEKPFGYGINNYELAFQKYISEYDIHNVETAYLNKKDGSTNFAKIVTEFGIFSIFLFYFLFSFVLSKNIDIKMKIFFIIPIFLQLFVRGVGYFNAGFLLFLFYAFIIWREKHSTDDKIK